MMQFQMFLQQLIPAMEFGTALMTPLAVLLAILYSCDGGNLRKTFRKAAYWGILGLCLHHGGQTGDKKCGQP